MRQQNFSNGSKKTEVEETSSSHVRPKELKDKLRNFNLFFGQKKEKGGDCFFTPFPLSITEESGMPMLGPRYFGVKPASLRALDTSMVRAFHPYSLSDIEWSSWGKNSSVLGSNPEVVPSGKFKPLSEWVEDLCSKFGAKWKNNGIYDAIMLSKKKIALNLLMLSATVCYLNSTSNTFDFGLGPVTPTILDKASLFGFRPHEVIVDALGD